MKCCILQHEATTALSWSVPQAEHEANRALINSPQYADRHASFGEAILHFSCAERRASLKKALASASAFFLVRDVLALILLLSISYLLLCSWRRFARLRRLSSHITACLRNQRTTCVLAPTKKRTQNCVRLFVGARCETWTHTVSHTPLKRARLPIPPISHCLLMIN